MTEPNATHDSQAADPTPNLPTDRRALLAGIGGLAAGAFLASKAHAGPLNPPTGPIAPTGKTLTEVEPRIAVNSVNTPASSTALFRISQPGSYYLTGNITGVAGRAGIEIAASGVTLDLNGFDLVGVPGAAGTFAGILTSTSGLELRNIAILNGSVRNWAGSGVLFGFSTASGRVEGVLATANTGGGISVGNGVVIAHCTASFNSFSGISAGSDCVITNCLARSNSNNGIVTQNNCTITNCTARGNASNGIWAADDCTIANCSASFNPGNGIRTSSGSRVSNCSANSNSGDGIRVFDRSSVTDCIAARNSLDGIECTQLCTIRENNCSGNGFSGGDGAGIHVIGFDNRIEGNNCTGADRGIDVDQPGNIIIRNTCSGNTINYAIVANNRYGPIINIRATGTAAVNGSSAPDTSGTTHPWANFAY